MTFRQSVLSLTLTGFAVALGVGMPALPFTAQAATTTSSDPCDPANAAGDDDGDGFLNAQECQGITTIGTQITLSDGTTATVGQVTYQRCTAGMAREACVDPASKDLFVVYMPLAAGSILAGGSTAIGNPFAAQSAYGLTFNGYSGLNVTVHLLDATQVPASTRQVSSASAQKAVLVVENLDASDLNTLAYCPWGRPDVDGQGICTIYSQRIVNAIALACGTLSIVTAGGAQSDAAQVFKAYAIETILHEVGHSIGGLAPKYDSRFGGYHYAPGTIMEQYVVASTSKGSCKFAISQSFNLRYDPPAVFLK